MRLRRAMLQSLVQQALAMLLSFATGVIIARLMTPQQVGPYAIAMAAVNTTAALKDFGVGAYVISHPKDDAALLRAAYGITLVMAVMLAGLSLAASFPLAAFYREPEIAHVLCIVAIAQLLQAVAFPGMVLLTRGLRFDCLLVIGMAGAISQFAMSVFLAWLGMGAAALAWGYVAAALIAMCATLALAPQTVGLRPTLRGSRQLLRFGGWMSAALVTGSTAGSLPELMIGRSLGSGDTAIFSRAQNIVAIIRNGLFAAMMRPMLPRLGASESNGESLAPLYLRIIETVTGLAWPAYALLAVWAEPLVRLLYGPAWSTAAGIIMPLAIAHGLTLAVAPHYDVLIVKRRAGVLFACEMAVLCFTFLALSRFLQAGLSGAVWGLALGSGFFAAVYFFVLRPMAGFAVAELVAVWARSLALAVAVAAAALVLRHGDFAAPGDIALRFCLAGGLSACAWLIMLRLVRHELLAPVQAVFRTIWTHWLVVLAKPPAKGI